jgi:50S ribosome-binding GTPase
MASKAASQDKVKPADAGRIVLHQANIKRLKPGQVKLCAGCGTEVRRLGRADQQISAHQVIAGVDAADENRTKNQSKKARYAEAAEANKGAFLCDRCRALQSDNIYRAYDALADVSPEVFSSQLRHIVGRRRYGLCLVVVDSTDPEHSAVKHLRRSIGTKTPIWLIFNKVDLVPRLNYRERRSLSARIASLMDVGKFHEVFGVSAITGKGIPAVAERLLQTLGGKDVFVVGCANVGKSTLVHQLSGVIATAAYLKGKRGLSRRELCNNLAVTGSHLPGTTLQAVRIPCFSSDRHALWDTPGIINKKAVQYSLFPVHIMEPMARPEAIPMPSREAGTEGQWRPGYSVLIEAAWMDDPDQPAEEVVRDILDGQDAVSKEMKAENQSEETNEKEVRAKEEDSEEDDDEEDDDEDEEDDDEEDDEEDHDDDEEDEVDGEEEGDGEKVEEDDEDDDSDDDDIDKESDDDDSDDDDLHMKRKKAALEKRRKVIEAAKERRRLRMEQEAAKNQKNTKGKGKEISVEKDKPIKEYRGPCVLGRIDLISLEYGHSIFAQAYVHPALRIRIVPTSEAPDHATVPTRYLNVIRKRMQQATGKQGTVATNLKSEYSLPLKAYTSGMENGELKPGPKEYRDNYQTYFMDVVFASLGWISVSHRGSFTLVPYCVEGSVYSKRPSIYPTNLAAQLEKDDMEEDPFHGMTEDEINDRLRQAARQGRHAGGGTHPPSGGSGRNSAYASYADGDEDGFDFGGLNEAEEDPMWY